ncbi:MAG TPA: hypothetical protein ENF42_03795 [Candidatus Bathyarchaeota archaeon]|nr:hypothetical protein [Candidatus Bathyarchaeota archaeon]
MKVRVKYYGVASELAGIKEELIEIDGRPTLRQIINTLPSKSKASLNSLLRGGMLMEGLRIALNHKIVDDMDVEVDDGSIIAFLPPSSGG